MARALISPKEAADNTRINYPLMIKAKNVPCMDCGLIWHPAVMTLDHRDRATKFVTNNGRRLDPSAMLSYPTEQFQKMLTLCDPVCGNCHKIREMRRDKVAFHPRWKMYTYRLHKGAMMS